MSNTEVKKTVDMVAYDAEQNFSSPTNWANEFVEPDLTETKRIDNEYTEVTLDLGSSPHTVKLQPYQYTEEKLNKLLSMANREELQVEEVNETELAQKHRTSPAISDFLNEIAGVIPDTFTVGLDTEEIDLNLDNSYVGRVRWVDTPEEDTFTHSLKIGRGNLDKRRVLSKESERENDDLYETMAKVPSLKFQIQMRSDKKNVIDGLTDGVIPKLHKRLSEVDSIGKVRYVACEVQETQQGECYNI